MDENKIYIGNVEIFAPGYTCHEETWNVENSGKQNFAPYEFPVVGALEVRSRLSFIEVTNFYRIFYDNLQFLLTLLY